MALDSGFMASLMNIPYFKELVDENGEEWLEAVFDALETDSYDFEGDAPVIPEIALKSVDELVALDEAQLEAADTDSATSTVSTDAVEAKQIPADSAPARRDDGIEEVAAAMTAKSAQQAEAAGKADNEGGRSIHFDNVALLPFYLTTYVKMGPGVYYNPNEAVYRPILVASLSGTGTNWTAESDEAAIVALNGDYRKLTLSSLADKIYTAAGSGETVVNGGEGSDTLYLTAGGLKANLGGISDLGHYGGKVEFKSVENVIGSDGNDTIFGDQADNKLVGRGGDDKIDGGAGNDTITGGGGSNTLNGGAGDDAITGGGGQDTIDGGAGKDTIKSGGGADKITAGEGDDSIEAGTGDDTVSGGDGNDTIKGEAGKDTLDGGAGNDTISAGDDDDKVTGGDGDDILNGEAGNDTVEGGKGKDTIHGNDGNDTLKGDDGADKLFGDAGNDTIDGGGDADEINGGDGDDKVTAGDGDDTVVGGAGKDTIDGGAGADKITGSAGADTMTGGAGADTFIYTSKDDSGTAADTFDIITDFDVASDKFDLSAVLASDSFDFIAAEGGAFTGTGAEVRWDKDGGKTFVEIDVDGDGTADMKIQLNSEVDLTASHFTL